MSAVLTRQGWGAIASVIILLVYGLAVAIGNTLGGKFANHNPLKALATMFALVAVLMFIMVFGLGSHFFGLALILIMGLFAFMNVPGLQLFTMQAAEELVPEDAQLASALNISAFNVGIVIGSFIGGQLLNQFGLLSTPAGGVLMAVLALVITLVMMRQAQTSK